MFKKNLPMTGFEPDVSDFGSNGAVNFATTTAQFVHNFQAKMILSQTFCPLLVHLALSDNKRFWFQAVHM